MNTIYNKLFDGRDAKEEIENLLSNVDILVSNTLIILSEAQKTAYNYLIDFLDEKFSPTHEASCLLYICFEMLEEQVMITAAGRIQKTPYLNHDRIY